MSSDDPTPHSSTQQFDAAGHSPTHGDAAADRPAAQEPDKMQHARIRIGSQRRAQRNPAAKPKPATSLLPAGSALRVTAIGSEPQPTGPPRGGSPPPGGEDAPSAPPASADLPASGPAAVSSCPRPAPQPPAGGEQLAPPPAAPLPRPILNQPKSGPPPVREQSVPLPNLRAPLSADMEQELAAALGDVPLDEMLSSPASATAPELEVESRHRGRVLGTHRDNVFIDLGAGRQGVLALRSLGEPPEPGTELDVQIARFEPAEGLYELTVPGGAVSVEDWSQVAEGMVVEVRVTGHNKGGLECEAGGLARLHSRQPVLAVSRGRPVPVRRPARQGGRQRSQSRAG